ncbi:MAG: response regulator, partial [Desulfobacteraceae bacterium]|nr:response regulator [Desulfobacteraceae bacterium]
MDQMSILVVDDDPQIREIIEELVQSFGHACRSAGNGLDALNLIKKERFDIVICDIKMPGMDGLQVMTEVRKMNLDLPFIIITGFGEEYSYDGVVGSGAQDFIKKPFTTSELETKLNRIFEERLLEEKNRGLFERQVSLNEKLSALLDIAADLSSELDFDRL